MSKTCDRAVFEKTFPNLAQALAGVHKQFTEKERHVNNKAEIPVENAAVRKEVQSFLRRYDSYSRKRVRKSRPKLFLRYQPGPQPNSDKIVVGEGIASIRGRAA